MVFVGWTEEDDEVAVEFEVPFGAAVVCVAPWSNVCDSEPDERVIVAFVALLAIVLIPKIVVDPRVVVLVEESLVTAETIADVVIADAVSVDTVMVEEYVRYFPVGVAASVTPPVKTI